MALPGSINGREFSKFVESSTTPGQTCVVVSNPDGTNVGASVTVTADTEFPAAAALADNTANPTTTLVGAMLELWDGATWDRAPGNATDGQLVNLGTNNDVIATGNVAHDSVDSGNPVGIGGEAVDPASLPADVDVGDRVKARFSQKGELLVYLSRLIAGEDQTNNVLKTEHQYAFTRCTADTQVKASAGFIHTITIQSTDATPTAGSIIIYDNTAESGTEICRFDVKATANVGIQSSQTILLDIVANTGIYVGFTTVADVAVTLSWR